MSSTVETLYIVIGPRTRGSGRLRIVKVSKRRPVVKLGHALAQINVRLPDDVLRPPVVTVEIQPDQIRAPAVVVEGVKA